MKKPKKANNERKQLCKKCKYHGTISVFQQKGPYEPEARICCDYIGVTGHARILVCDDPENCTVYKPGKPIRHKEQYPKVTKNF